MATGDGNAEGQDYDVTAPLSIWIDLIVLSATSFWAQACITEERCVLSRDTLQPVLLLFSHYPAAGLFLP